MSFINGLSENDKEGEEREGGLLKNVKFWIPNLQFVFAPNRGEPSFTDMHQVKFWKKSRRKYFGIQLVENFIPLKIRSQEEILFYWLELLTLIFLHWKCCFSWRNTISNNFMFSISDVVCVLQRMTIVGVILSFRQLAQEALVDVLEERIPFLLSSILDFRHHAPPVADVSVSLL